MDSQADIGLHTRGRGGVERPPAPQLCSRVVTIGLLLIRLVVLEACVVAASGVGRGGERRGDRAAHALLDWGQRGAELGCGCLDLINARLSSLVQLAESR